MTTGTELERLARVETTLKYVQQSQRQLVDRMERMEWRLEEMQEGGRKARYMIMGAAALGSAIMGLLPIIYDIFKNGAGG